MTTARDIVKGALKLIRVIRKNENPSDDEADDGLNALNGMLQTWSNDGLLCYSLTWESFTLTADDGEYTIGAGQDFATVRPIKIDHAFIRWGITDYPLEIIDADQYNMIGDKSTSSIPEQLNYDPQYPYGKIRLYPKPSQAYTLYIFSEKLITSFASLDTTVSLPDGWEEALKHALAQRLAPEYGVDISPALFLAINQVVGAIKRNKARKMVMAYEGEIVRKFAFEAGE